MLAVAVVDDLGAILIVAFFYTEQVLVDYLLMASGVIVAACVPLKARDGHSPLNEAEHTFRAWACTPGRFFLPCWAW